MSIDRMLSLRLEREVLHKESRIKELEQEIELMRYFMSVRMDIIGAEDGRTVLDVYNESKEIMERMLEHDRW